MVLGTRTLVVRALVGLGLVKAAKLSRCKNSCLRTEFSRVMEVRCAFRGKLTRCRLASADGARYNYYGRS
jgi:hypothetical protein